MQQAEYRMADRILKQGIIVPNWAEGIEPEKLKEAAREISLLLEDAQIIEASNVAEYLFPQPGYGPSPSSWATCCFVRQPVGSLIAIVGSISMIDVV